MTDQQEIEQELQRLEKFNDPVLLMMIFLALPAVIMATIFSSFGDGTLIKVAIALCFLFFTWLSFKVNSVIKKRIETLQDELKTLE
ncbi:MAG: RnfABCDGE type electron transport complex subunit D [Gammaproteobacteria bacterium]|nr:RnfABCDGE type electron transport complex subunit D [Gammaproteobacteria bacterium]